LAGPIDSGTLELLLDVPRRLALGRQPHGAVLAALGKAERSRSKPHPPDLLCPGIQPRQRRDDGGKKKKKKKEKNMIPSSGREKKRKGDDQAQSGSSPQEKLAGLEAEIAHHIFRLQARGNFHGSGPCRD